MKMINSIYFLLLVTTFAGCIIETNISKYHDTIPPLPPANIYSITGDGWVELHWQHIFERDLAFYNIYRSYSYNGKYQLIGSTYHNFFIDYSVKNGTTYYYAITSVDKLGNESELSYDVIYDTPRPEGYNQIIYNFRSYPYKAGYDFSTYSVVAYNDDRCDMFFDNDNGDFYMVVYDDTDIRDMGPTSDIYDIDQAPNSGWSPTKEVRLYEGHTYVVWTWDNHFAKFRVKFINSDLVIFDWAYQLVEGNRELKSSRIFNSGIREINKENTFKRIKSRNKLNG